MKKIVGALIVLGVVFLAGFIPARLSLQRARKENARLQFDLSLARLEGKLGMIGEEVRRNNFANAAAISTEFFDGLRGQLADPRMASEPNRKAALTAIAARRDEITSDLGRADPAIKDKLAQMYRDFAEGISGG